MTTARLISHPPTPPSAATAELTALRIAYSDLATIATSLDEQDSWRPTRCAGWSVRELVLHLLGDAQRGLVALATPAAGPTDRDAVTYWARSSFGDDPHFRDLRALRAMASAWEFGRLAHTFAETTGAVLRLAARTAPDALLGTQNHVLRGDDLLATLAVEAAVHHLDLVVDLPHRPGPRAEPLALVRRTLDGLLGQPAPEDWPDERWALLGSGRVPPGGAERRTLGARAGSLPLLG